MTPLSLKGYACHRRTLRLPGNTLRAVQEAVAAERIPMRPDGTIDPVEADAAWEQNTDGSRRPLTSVNGHAPGGSLPEAKRLESLERARGLKLANDRRTGELVEAAAVERLYATLVVATKNKIRGVPSRLKARIPHLTVEELAIVAELLDEALTELADGR